MARLMLTHVSQNGTITYEHYCDTLSDRNEILDKYITLGSYCFVLHGTNGVDIYVADSNKTWCLTPTARPNLQIKNVSTNGTVIADRGYDGLEQVIVHVLGNYGEEDEGKVILNGELIPQTSRTITENGTYNTISNNEVIVNGIEAESLIIDNNGTYTASTGKAYSPVVVNVQPTLQSKTITQNGTITPDQGYDGLSSVVVNVSGDSRVTGVYVGVEDPETSIGNNGDYYYQRTKVGESTSTNSEEEYGFTDIERAEYGGSSAGGYEFIANEPITIIGLRVLSEGTSGTVTLRFARLDDDDECEILKTIYNVPKTGSWTTIYFDTPILLATRRHYIVMASGGGSGEEGIKYQKISFTVFNSKITCVQGRRFSTYVTELPGAIDSDHIYGADIIIASNNNIYSVTKQYYKSADEWVEIT